jgi:hypothetical protein
VASVSSRLVVRFAVAALAFGVTLSAQARLPVPAPAQQSAPFVPEPGGARVAALGFDSLLSDFYWLRAVQLVGGERGSLRAAGPLIGRLVDVVVGLDPWVDHPYRFAAVWISEVPEALPTADRLLERGIAYHPLDWRNRFYLSFNLFYYQRDAAAAARELEPAVGMPGAPSYLGRLFARLRAQDGDLDVIVAYLQTLLRNAPDEWHRADYAKALDEVETERRARLLDQARELYRQRTGRDIERVADLASPARDAVMPELPTDLHGGEWVIDPEGRIVSSYYGHRYEINDENRVARTSHGLHQGQKQAAAAGSSR